MTHCPNGGHANAFTSSAILAINRIVIIVSLDLSAFRFGRSHFDRLHFSSIYQTLMDNVNSKQETTKTP